MMFSLRKSDVIVAAITLASLAGCGQYGPLYLPSKPAPRNAAQGGAQDSGQPQSASKGNAQDDKQDSDFNAQPPALDKSRQP